MLPTTILKSASVLGQSGMLAVDVATESRPDRDARVEREQHERNVNRLRLLRQMTPNCSTVAELKRKVAEYEGSQSPND